ncbi:hypothetical protein GEMRC1_004227 [Eukaryota sp. GEM-RC1]
MSQPSDEFVAEVQKLQQTLSHKVNTLHQTQARLMERDRDRRRADLTLQELSTLPSSARVFQSLGKTFVLKPTESIREELTTQSKKCGDELVALKSLQQKLQSDSVKIEKELGELFRSSQQ